MALFYDGMFLNPCGGWFKVFGGNKRPVQRLRFAGMPSTLAHGFEVVPGRLYDVRFNGMCPLGLEMAITDPSTGRSAICPYSTKEAFEANWSMPDNEIDG